MDEFNVDDAVEIVTAQAMRGYDASKLQHVPLSKLQLDILELEDASFNRPGEKLSEFKCRWPGVTMLAYGLVLLRMLGDQRAYEYDDGRYAATLTRIQRLHAQAMDYRTRLRGDVTSEQ